MSEGNFERDMARMQSLFDQVKHGYDLFFSGARTDPPSRERAELDRMFKTYSNGPINRLAQQFLFSSFSNKYILHSELWNKWLRAREDGLSQDPRLPAAIRKAKRDLQDLERGRVASPSEPEPSPEEAERLSRQSPPARQPQDGKNIRLLYDEFLNAKLQSGEMPELDFASFENHVARQREAILKKYQGKDVIFTVKNQDGRVSLRAKVVK